MDYYLFLALRLKMFSWEERVSMVQKGRTTMRRNFAVFLCHNSLIRHQKMQPNEQRHDSQQHSPVQTLVANPLALPMFSNYLHRNQIFSACHCCQELRTRKAGQWSTLMCSLNVHGLWFHLKSDTPFQKSTEFL